MTQTICRNCRVPFSEGDAFCGDCGSSRADVEIPGGPAGDANGQAAGFFRHGPPVPPPDAEGRTNATRYLCAGAYLSPWFANKVIGELIASHRAVAPSRGIDLEPIIRHCLKARRMKRTRDIVLSVLLLVGLFTATIPLIFVLAVSFLGGFLPAAQWKRRSFGGKALVGLAAFTAVFAVGGILILGFVVVIVLFIVAKLAGSVGSTSLPLSGLFSAGLLGLWSLVYVILLLGTLVSYFWRRNKTLISELRPGATAPAFRRESPRVENRIAEVCQAQYGNLTLYSKEDPFIGTGFIPELFTRREEGDRPVWSITIELSRAGAPRGLLGFNARDRVDIDPVDLHRILRARLKQLNDPALPDSQRVAQITVDDHVVGEGTFYWDSPLIDRQRMIPYSQALPDAIEALIRAPQGRLRYYQRVSISDEGQPVLAENLQRVIGSVDREIITSAFIYVAVEGHMFYLQFVPKALAPVDPDFREIDTLPMSSSGRFAGKVMLDTLRGAFLDIVTAPYKVYKALRLSFKEWRNFSKEARADADYAYADVGARMGVRELGSQNRYEARTYIQDLDIDKYTHIVERLVLETVLDYLVTKGADTAAYRASAASIVNSTVISGNTGDWNVNTGAGNQRVSATGV